MVHPSASQCIRLAFHAGVFLPPLAITYICGELCNLVRGVFALGGVLKGHRPFASPAGSD